MQDTDRFAPAHKTMSALIDQTIERMYALNVGVVGQGAGRHERPHKPLLLLAVLDLLDGGQAMPDRIPWGELLRERFSRYFDLVRQRDDRDTPENPFRYLASDGFWEIYRITPAGAVPHEGEILVRDSGTLFARLVDGVDLVVADANLRHRLRQALVARYFPDAATQLMVPLQAVSSEEDEEEPAEPGRNAGFRRKIIEVYDHQCAACGLRIKLPVHEACYVDAAHLIPFSESGNDHPTNGIALCKNHHWAMDRHLIAPTPAGVWKVSRVLIGHRSTGEAELVRLADHPVLPPSDDAYRPDPAAMQWRVERLIA